MKSLKTIDENNLIFIDIETVRVVKELQKDTQLYDAWVYKCRNDIELRKRKLTKKLTLEKLFQEKAPLYAPFGRVVAVVVGRIKENKIYIKTYTAETEKELLENFNKDLNIVYEKNSNVRFCSFAGVGFDIPFLEKRLICNGIEPCTLLDEGGEKPWLLTHIDLKNIWKANSFYPDSLIAVASCLGLPSPKDALDGTMVSEYFYSGKIDEIINYCCKDVETVARIFRKLSFREDLIEGYELLNKIEIKPLPMLERILQTKKLTAEDVEKIKSIQFTDEEKIKALDLVIIALGTSRKKIDKEIVALFGTDKIEKHEIQETKAD